MQYQGPSVGTPPASEAYSYLPMQVTSPTESESATIESSLRGRINRDYLLGNKLTPMMKRKIAVAVASALALIAAVAIIVATVVTGALPLVTLAIPVFAAGGFGLYYCFTAVDLDSPKECAAVAERVATSTFADIAEEFNRDQVIGYGLLDGIAFKGGAANGPRRVALYHAFDQLSKDYHGIKARASDDCRDAAHTQALETRDFVEWYDLKRSILDHRSALRHTATAVVENANQRPSRGLRVLNTVCDVSDIFTIADLNAIHREKVGPWEAWLRRQRNAIQSAKIDAFAALEQQWQTAKAHA